MAVLTTKLTKGDRVFMTKMFQFLGFFGAACVSLVTGSGHSSTMDDDKLASPVSNIMETETSISEKSDNISINLDIFSKKVFSEARVDWRST